MPDYAVKPEPMQKTGPENMVTVFQTKEARAANPGLEPQFVVDEAGNPLVGVEFLRLVSEYGRSKSTVFEVRIPRNRVPANLEPGMYVLENPVVNVYADKSGRIRESWSATGINDQYGEPIES